MKKVLILTRKDDRESYDQKQTYTAGLAAIETKCEYVVEEFENLLFWFDGNDLRVLLPDGVTDIASFDAVFLIAWFKSKMLEDVALSVSVYLHAKGVKVVNTEALYTRSRSKLSQYVYAALNDIKITPFLFSLSSETLASAIETKWPLDYPVIMKGAQSSRGNDNYLLKSKEEALGVAQTMNDVEGPWFVLQSFVPNDGDYRIIVMGDAVTSVIHRQSQNESHLNNTSKGGKAELFTSDVLPEQVVQDSIKLSKLLRREVTGVDMICHRETGEYFLLEINNMPQMATGSYVSEKLTELDAFLGRI